jgi:DUF971 family protein
MTRDPRTTIKAVRAPHGATAMEIDWADGVTSRIEHWIIRGFCPCADCQGHAGPIRFVPEARDRASSQQLRDIRRVGNYALELTWGDGHASGIYTFGHLRLLASLTTRPEHEIIAFQPPRGN